MKALIPLLFILFLQGCIYAEGCWISPQMVSCVDKGKTYPLIAGYQKPETLGKTNSTQRWQDFVACGGKMGDQQIRYYPRNYTINGKFYKEFDDCMFEKGYIFLPPAQCGYQNPKWDKGKCNL